MERADLQHWKAREVARLLALVETERRYYQEIVSTVPIGLLVLSRDLTVLSANRAFRRTFGVKSQDVVRRPLEEVLPVEGLPAEVEAVLASGIPVLNRIFEMPSEATTRILRVGIQRVRSWSEDGDEEVLISLEDFSGVEGAKKVEEPLALPDPREEVAAVVWEADPAQLRFTYVNRMAEELLGYPIDAWTGDASFWTRRIHPEDREWLNEFYRRAAGSGVSHRCEYRAVRADGGIVWLRDIVRVARAEDGRAERFSGVSIDITERRTVEDQILEARKFDSLSRVMGKAAHGFNNLLMIIGGYGDQLLSGLGADDPLRADIEEILRATGRVSDVSAQLQSYTRRPASHPAESNAGEFLKSRESTIRAALPANIALEVVAGTDLKIKADPAQLDQILRSFVGQSVRGLSEGGTLKLQVQAVELGEDYAARRSALRPGTHVAFLIRDNGRGLDADSRRRLFEPAFGQPQAPGGAIPIAAAYGLLRQNGGDVTVRSSRGEGCEFRLLFPAIIEAGRIAPPRVPLEEPPAAVAEAEVELAPEQEVPAESPAPADTEEAPGPQPEESASPAAATSEPAEAGPVLLPAAEEPALLPEPREGAQTVLVVEDEAGIRMLMKKILDRQGYHVIEATGGEEALRIVEQRNLPVQLLVTDLVMPQMGGRELAEKLAVSQPGLKVLYVSGFTDDEAIRSGSLGPGAEFLQKPFTLGSLVEKVREMLSEEQQ